MPGRVGEDGHVGGGFKNRLALAHDRSGRRSTGVRPSRRTPRRARRASVCTKLSVRGRNAIRQGQDAVFDCIFPNPRARPVQDNPDTSGLTDGPPMPHAAIVVVAPQQSLVSPGRPMTDAGTEGHMTSDRSAGAPEVGALHIKQGRSFAPWQLVVAVAVALLVGMVIGNSGGGGVAPKPPTKAYTPPPPANSSSPTSAPTTTAGSPGSSPTTSPTGGAGSRIVPSTTAPAGTGPAQVLLPQKQATGAWTSTPFTVGAGQWNIGWAYRCSPAPASGPAFQIFVVPAGGSPGPTPAVSETSASVGSTVTTQSTIGSQQLEIQAPSSCTWAVKVTGIG